MPKSAPRASASRTETIGQKRGGRGYFEISIASAIDVFDLAVGSSFFFAARPQQKYPSRSIPFRSVPFRFRSVFVRFCSGLFRFFFPFCFVRFCSVPFRFAPFRFVWFHPVLSRFLSFRSISFHFCSVSIPLPAGVRSINMSADPLNYGGVSLRCLCWPHHFLPILDRAWMLSIQIITSASKLQNYTAD